MPRLGLALGGCCLDAWSTVSLDYRCIAVAYARLCIRLSLRPSKQASLDGSQSRPDSPVSSLMEEPLVIVAWMAGARV